MLLNKPKSTVEALLITGIDTGVGKTLITGWLAKNLREQGLSLITQKLVQTGCENESEDLLQHRQIMNIPMQKVDKQGLTCPYIYPFPASPHLSAKLEGKTIDLEKINAATDALLTHYKHVLIEGAGGLMVPLTPEQTLLGFAKINQLPICLVTSAKLGSINHTLLSLEACKQHQIQVHSVIFNHYPQSPSVISEDSKQVFQTYLHTYFPKAKFLSFKELSQPLELGFLKV